MTTQGKYEEAKLLLTRSLAIDEKVLGPEHPEVAESLGNLADLVRSQVRIDCSGVSNVPRLLVKLMMFGVEWITAVSQQLQSDLRPAYTGQLRRSHATVPALAGHTGEGAGPLPPRRRQGPEQLRALLAESGENRSCELV